MTKKSINNKLNFLIGRKQAYERGDFFGTNAGKDRKQMADYQLWTKASPASRKDWDDEWEHYYTDVRETPTYALYMAMKDAYNRADRDEMKRLNVELSAIRSANILVLDMPKCPDPAEMEGGSVIASYLQICSSIDRINREMESEGLSENNDKWD